MAKWLILSCVYILPQFFKGKGKSSCCRKEPILTPCWNSFFDFLFVAVVTIIIHTGLPQRTLPLCLTVKLKCLCLVHRETIWPCPPVVVQAQLCLTLCNPMDCSIPGFPALQYLLIPACASSNQAFHMIYSVYKLNKQDNNIQPWRTPFPILSQSIARCPVLTVASWLAYRFLRQVRWSDIPVSWRIFHSLLWSTKSKALA